MAGGRIGARRSRFTRRPQTADRETELSAPSPAFPAIPVDEGAVPGGRAIRAQPPDQPGRPWWGRGGIGRPVKHLGVVDVAPAVAVEVVHHAVPVLIDEDVR